MTDYSQMSDADLMAAHAQANAAPSAGPWTAYQDKPADGPWNKYAHLSDAELLAAHAAANPSVGRDTVKSFGGGLEKGMIGLAGAPGMAADYLARGSQAATNFIADKLGIDPGPQAGGAVLPTPQSLKQMVEEKTGKIYEPQTRVGRYASKIGEFAPSTAIGPGGVIAKLLATVGGGVGSEAGGEATENLLGPAAKPAGEFIGGMLGGMSPAALGRVVTPLPTTAARQRLVDVLHDEGVNSLTAGQRTGNKGLQYAEDMLGNAPGAGGSATRIRDEGQQQFTEAAMRRAGQGLENATPEVLAANQQRLGNEFRDLSARNTLNPDNQFVTDIVAAARNYRRVPDSQQRQMVQGYLDDIIDHVNAGGMPGPQYQEMRSRLSRQANGLRQSDPTLSEALRDMRNALDDAMERSIGASNQRTITTTNPVTGTTNTTTVQIGPPNPDAELWRQSRREYGAQKTIEKVASRAGEATAEGQLVPANLRNTVAADNRGAYARGEGQFSELARAGAGVMHPLPNSGTAQRMQMQNLLMLPVTATVGRALMSRPAQAYLGNQAATRFLQGVPSTRAAIARALLSTGAR